MVSSRKFEEGHGASSSDADGAALTDAEEDKKEEEGAERRASMAASSDLVAFLTDCDKTKYAGTLSSAGILTVQDLAQLDADELSKRADGIPKTVARLLQKKAVAFEAAAAAAASTTAEEEGANDQGGDGSADSTGAGSELRSFLSDIGHDKFTDALLAAKISSVGDLANADLDALANAGVPKTISRLLQKKAAAAAAAEGATGSPKRAAEESVSAPEELRSFLSVIGRDKFTDALVVANISSVDDLASADVDILMKAGIPKTVARLLTKKASAALHESKGSPAGGGKVLRSFLSSIGRDKHTDALLAANISSVDGLANADVDMLSKAGVPKTVARLLTKKAAAAVQEANGSSGGSEELRSFLSGMGWDKFMDALLTANVSSVSDLANADVDILMKRGVPKTMARLLTKKAAQAAAEAEGSTKGEATDSSNQLRSFLSSLGRDKLADALLAAKINSVEDLINAGVDSLVKAGVPNTVARVLTKKANEFEKGRIMTEGESVREYKDNGLRQFDRALSKEAIDDVRGIWSAVRKASASFGSLFYEGLLEMETELWGIFDGVSMSNLGRTFDEAMDEFLSALDDTPRFLQLRDGFISRLVRYGIPARSLWMARDSFLFALSKSAPHVEVQHDLGNWTKFFRHLIPPFHPTLLRSMSLPDMSGIEDVSFDIVRKFAGDGHSFYAEWLKENPNVLPDIWDSVRKLKAWQAFTDKSDWSTFQGHCAGMVNSCVTPDIFLGFLSVDLPSALGQLVDGTKLREWEDALQVVAGAIHGPDQVIHCIRGRQLQMVQQEWALVYERAHDDFGELFYEHFTANPLIANLFTHTNFAMQRKNFVHQFNSILLRIDEDMDEVVKPQLLELGARHRVHHLVGLRDMQAASASILHALKFLIGKVHFAPMENSWTYAASLINFYMVSGWACGLVFLEDPEKKNNILIQWPGGKDLASGTGDWASVDTKVLVALRNKSKVSFSRFFAEFSKGVGQNHISESAARYEAVVNRFLDEQDIVISRERLSDLGRRHTKYHGVTLSHLKPASCVWMSAAEDVFGAEFKYTVALEWARLWTLIATSMCPEYKETCPSAIQLAARFEKSNNLRASYVRRIQEKASKSSAQKTKKGCELTLVGKKLLPGRICHLVFKCAAPQQFRAGQYAKIRWTVSGGKTRTRFYSIASAPDPQTGTADTMELCIKVVASGNVSPFVYNDFAPQSSCQLLLTAGHFTLPEPVGRLDRLMLSGGIGIVAFIGVIRSAAELCRKGLLEHKLSLTLIHSDRSVPFPFMDDLLPISEEFGRSSKTMFQLKLVLRITREDPATVKNLKQNNPQVDVDTERLGAKTIKSSLGDFQCAVGPHVYMCGPGGFQKALRATLLNGCGHPKKYVHQEFFDL